MVTLKVYVIVYIVIGVHYFTNSVKAKLSENDLKAFNDKILFEIDWPGEDLGFVSVPSVLLRTSHNEKYKCLVPRFRDTGRNPPEHYTGPNPYELLKPVLSENNSCSYSLESYWTYELCHGKHIRQYHEERQGKQVLVEEYFLGKWDEEEASNIEKELANEKEPKFHRSETPFMKINGLKRRYVQLIMTGGTLCDLNQRPRRTKVMYICYQHGNQEIYSLKETSTCEYEVIVLSKVLCSHPKYKPQESSEYVVSCHSVENAPKVPKGLVDINEERYRLQRLQREHTYKSFGVSIAEMRQVLDGKHKVKFDTNALDPPEKRLIADETSALTVTTPVASLFSGTKCLHGGTGWWKYKFCHGKSVDQYHIEKDLNLTVINLGKFVIANHLKWLEENPLKRPKPAEMRKSISHFYSEGLMCEKTGRPRQTEVKLKCLDHISSPSEVALYLLEPRPCEYILGVESHLVCENVNLANKNGLVMSRGSGEEQEYSIDSLERSRLGEEKAEEGEINDAAITNGDD